MIECHLCTTEYDTVEAVVVVSSLLLCTAEYFQEVSCVPKNKMTCKSGNMEAVRSLFLKLLRNVHLRTRL